MRISDWSSDVCSSDLGGERQKDDVTPWYKSVRKPAVTHFDFDISRQRGVRDFPESVQGQRVVLAKLCSQSRGEGSKAVSPPVPAIKFNAMPMSVVETDRHHMLELLERPHENGRGALHDVQYHQRHNIPNSHRPSADPQQTTNTQPP